MRVVTIQSQKGGPGKTTIVVHLTAYAPQAGEGLVLVDTEPQGSATTWGDARESDQLTVTTACPAEMAQVIEAVKAEGYPW